MGHRGLICVSYVPLFWDGVMGNVEQYVALNLAYRINPLKPNDLQRRRAVSQQIHQLFIQFINYVWFRHYIAIFRERS
jgi:hypothetical protein